MEDFLVTYYLITSLIVLIIIKLVFRDLHWELHGIGLLGCRLKKTQHLRRPPGPRSWPVIGNLLHVLWKPLHIALTSLSSQYGDLMWLRMGGDNVLVISSMEAARECILKQGRIFAGRPRRRQTVKTLLGDGRDIAMSDIGPDLKYYRRQVHSFFASPNQDNRARLESIVGMETRSLMKALDTFACSGDAFDPHFNVARVVANVLCLRTLNRRFEHVDANFHQQLRIIQDIVDSIESFNIVDVFPWLQAFPIPSWTRFKKSLETKDIWMADVIKEHRETLSEDNVRDLLDFLLLEQKKAKDEGNEEVQTFLNDNTIGHIVYELFGGGIESTTITILWFIIYLLHHPEWQDIISEEVRARIETTGPLSPFDRNCCPNLDAAIKETLRLASVLPLGFPHRLMKDTTVRGYHIPEDSMVILNIWAIHHDPKVWEDSYTFNPRRFLDPQGQSKSYLPFGLGHRVCVGSTVAKMEIFMFCAYLVTNFVFTCPQGEPLPDITGRAGLTIRPKPFKICLKRRL
ncbi:steroid 17-alpha-hydroxylase/17,20 lyase-like [Argonauta hians]